MDLFQDFFLCFDLRCFFFEGVYLDMSTFQGYLLIFLAERHLKRKSVAVTVKSAALLTPFPSLPSLKYDWDWLYAPFSSLGEAYLK